jgi:hypothetical protein
METMWRSLVHNRVGQRLWVRVREPEQRGKP